jgi:hypothetical protein
MPRLPVKRRPARSFRRPSSVWPPLTYPSPGGLGPYRNSLYYKPRRRGKSAETKRRIETQDSPPGQDKSKPGDTEGAEIAPENCGSSYFRSAAPRSSAAATWQ